MDSDILLRNTFHVLCQEMRTIGDTLKAFIFRSDLKWRAGMLRTYQGHWWMRMIFHVPLVEEIEPCIRSVVRQKLN